MRPELPTGTVTFLFTDVEGSTSLLRELGPEEYASALADHRSAIREACAENGGVEVDTQGDAFFFAFPTAPGALAAASDFTARLATSGPIRVRVGLHTGTPLVGDEGYVGHDVHRAARIAAAGHGGQVLVSASTARLVDVELADLGEHRLKDLAESERVYQLGDDDFLPLKTLYRTNLPVPVTPFLGREAELEEVLALLSDEDGRLVTLSGPGGTGKTRLALEAASRGAECFPDGVDWVALAPLRDVGLVLGAIAQALGIGVSNEAETIGVALSGQTRLLVMDNCEHLLPILASTIASLRDSADMLTILATSRERLQLSGERSYAVPGLSAVDGVELFAARAAAMGIASPSSNAVAELCDRLDQLPLAIELAAARSAVLSPEQLLERLGQRLDLLKGARDADPRQQTLRATIEWSHDLLDESERRLFRELSVFRGGCTLEAAEAICAADLEILQSLLDKSLVRWREGQDGHHQYWMLETIREFAHEELDRAGDVDRLRDAHARWYGAQTEERAQGIRREELAAIAWVRSEIDNLRSALTTFLEWKQAEEAVALAANLSSYLNLVGAHPEHVDLAVKVDALNPAPSPGLARLQRFAAGSASATGDVDRRTALLAKAAATAEAAGDELERLQTALRQGELLYQQGHVAEARALMDRSLAGLRAHADDRALAAALYTYGVTVVEEPEQALPLLNEALEVSRNARLDMGVASSTQGLGWAHGLLGDYAVALSLGVESAARFAELGDREGVSYSLGNCARVFAELGNTQLAAALLAVAGRVRSELGIPHHEPDQEKTLALLEQSLGRSRLAELISASKSLDEDEAIRLVVEASPGVSDADLATPQL